jgi:hypothetical protein
MWTTDWLVGLDATGQSRWQLQAAGVQGPSGVIYCYPDTGKPEMAAHGAADGQSGKVAAILFGHAGLSSRPAVKCIARPGYH